MKQHVDRLTIRSVATESKSMLATLQSETRLPMALLIEEAITLLWNSYQEEGGENP